LTWIFNAKSTTANNATQTIPAIIASLCFVTFVDCFPAAALPDLLSRYGFISVEGKLSVTYGCCSVEAF
jgi:hypothetical protein